jgi:CopG family transcriptional regulator / antitoxin EndoAI
MHTLSQLEKQQVGLRLPKYLVEEMDELTKEFSINRTDIIYEAVKSYLAEQKVKRFYEEFDMSCKQINTLQSGMRVQTLQTLDGLIDELDATRS